MSPSAKIVHQTRGRLRLRIAEKRKDLPYFLDLYDQLRGAPGVNEVTMNPMTGTVLLRFDAQRRNTVLGVLADSREFALTSRPAHDSAELDEGDKLGRIDRFLSSRGMSVTDPRAIVFLIMLGLSIHQLRKGQILAPLLTLTFYGIDFAAAFRKGTQHPEQSGLANR